MLLTKIQTKEIFGQNQQIVSRYKIKFDGIEELTQYKKLSQKINLPISLKELLEQSQVELSLPLQELTLQNDAQMNLGQILINVQQTKQIFFDEISIKFIDYVGLPLYSFFIQWAYNDIINPFTLEYKQPQKYKVNLEINQIGQEYITFQGIRCYGVFPTVQRIVDSFNVEDQEPIYVNVQFKLDQNEKIKFGGDVQMIKEIEYKGKPQTVIIDDTIKNKKQKFIGLYRDIIYDRQTDRYTILISKNDIMKWFGKLIQCIMQSSNFYLFDRTIEDYQNQHDLFYVDINNNYTGILNVNYQYLFLLKYLLQHNHFKQIHSWDIGSGHSGWDSKNYDDLGYLIDDWRQLYNSIQGQNFEEKNQLAVNYSTDAPQYKMRFRQPVRVSLQVPWEYYGEIGISPREIANNLRLGIFDIENVITWKQFTGKDHTFEQEQQNYLFPEFIMVEAEIEENQQIGYWREFQIQGGCNFKSQDIINNNELFDLYQQNGYQTQYLSELEQEHDINRGIDFQLQQGVAVNENNLMVYPHGIYVDYKIHKVFYKTQTMKVIRQIIFGFLQVEVGD